MSRPKNAFEIFLLLERSNCGRCGEKACLASIFALGSGLAQMFVQIASTHGFRA
jgi:ArsR family metal-binding transcriptional regulator